MSRAVVLELECAPRETLLQEKTMLKQLQALVGGHIESVPHHTGAFVAYANEDGMALELPTNADATRRLRELGFFLPYDVLGTVVVLGCEEGSLTDAQITLVCRQ
jgi:hypothetical protein